MDLGLFPTMVVGHTGVSEFQRLKYRAALSKATLLSHFFVDIDPSC